MSLALSIITVNLNNVNGLLKTYSSILPILDLNVEWVVIDGGSVDGSVGCLLENIKRNIIKRNKLVIAEGVDDGIFDGMNKGVSLASGEHLWFLNSGDTLINDNEIIRWLNISKKKKSINYFYGFILNNKIRLPRPKYWIAWKMITSHQAMLIHKSVFNNFKYSISLSRSADYKLCIYILKNFSVEVSNVVLIENEPYGSDNYSKTLRKQYFTVCSDHYPALLCGFIYVVKVIYEKMFLRL